MSVSAGPGPVPNRGEPAPAGQWERPHHRKPAHRSVRRRRPSPYSPPFPCSLTMSLATLRGSGAFAFPDGVVLY